MSEHLELALARLRKPRCLFQSSASIKAGQRGARVVVLTEEQAVALLEALEPVTRARLRALKGVS